MLHFRRKRVCRRFSSLSCAVGLTLLLFSVAAAQLPPKVLCANGDPNGPDVAVLVYCAGSTQQAQGPIASMLCADGRFRSVTPIDGDSPSGVGTVPPTAQELGENFNCAVAVTNNPFPACTLDITDRTVLDDAGDALAGLVNNHGGGVVITGTGLLPKFFPPDTNQTTAGLGDAMFAPGVSPYAQLPTANPSGLGPGDMQVVASPPAICADMIPADILDGTFKYSYAKAFAVGALDSPGADQCAELLDVNGPGGKRGFLAVNVGRSVVGFAADSLLQGDINDEDYKAIMRNSAYLVCSPKIVEVSFDVRPGGCPNPFNPDSHGKLPVAILGSSSVNVADIDVSSIEVFGLPPEDRNSQSDTATPFTGLDPENPVTTACTSAGSDGNLDLNFKFPFPEIAQALTNHVNAQLLKDEAHILTITGTFATGPNAGRSFVGHDVVRIVKDGPLPTP